MTAQDVVGQPFIINNKQVDQFGYKALLIKNTNNSKAQFNFTTYLQRFSLFEGMFSKFMYVEGQIFDGATFVKTVGIQAGDIIKIDLFKQPEDSLDNIISGEFYIESVSGSTKLVSGKGEIFTFRAVSKIGFMALKSKIKRSFNGKASEIIQQICDKFFDLEPGKVSANNIEETFGVLNISASSLHPFDVIERINSQAVSPANKAGDNNFFFYETRQGVVYKSLRKIVQDANTFNYIIPADKNRSEESKDQDYFRILEIEVKTTDNQGQKVKEGVLENQTLTFDFILRKIEKKTFKLKDNFKDILLMGENLKFDMDEIDNLVGDEQRTTDEEQNVFPRCSSKSYDQQEDFISLKRGPSQAQYQLMNQTVISCRVLGNPKIKPGDIIELKAAQANPSDIEQRDPFLNGKFLVGSVKHVVIDAGTYETVVDLFKDGYELDISNFRRDTNSNLIKQRQ